MIVGPPDVAMELLNGRGTVELSFSHGGALDLSRAKGSRGVHDELGVNEEDQLMCFFAPENQEPRRTPLHRESSERNESSKKKGRREARRSGSGEGTVGTVAANTVGGHEGAEDDAEGADDEEGDGEGDLLDGGGLLLTA
ncbi:hypothetical protein NL676_003461 [Syzygium grande]|nr:hypothetical protein NL676_003461 [Syzygium grande]